MRDWKKLFILFAPLLLFCNPQGPDVLAGSAAFRTPHEQILQIEVSDHAIIGWDSFSIDAGETTHFLQPGPQSAVLNRVSGGDPSHILGTLHANGQVYLINPHGLVFGKDAVIDTTSFIASTFDLPDAEFLAGNDLHFSGDSKASIVNCGTIVARDGAAVLIGYLIDNQASISGQNAVLASAKEVVLTHADKQLLSVRIPVSETNAVQTIAREIEENGNPLSLAIRMEDRESASRLVQQGGRMLLTGAVLQTGEIEAETIVIYGEKCISGGPLTATREISIDAGANFVETAFAKLKAPSISIQAEGRLFTSGSYLSVSGSVELLGNEVVLAAAQIDASGTDGFGGGQIFIKGSKLLEVTGPSSIKANAPASGDGGKIVLLSDGTNRFSGTASAKGGMEKGDGGFIEISGHDLYCSGSPSVQAAHGVPGTILLDPFDIAIDVVATTTGGGFPYFNLIDPTEGSGTLGRYYFGFGIQPLTNGNIVISKPNDNTIAASAGAVYLYNGLTGALLSTLYGAFADDQIGFTFSGGLTALTNGNFVVASPEWNSGTGASTWGSGTLGFINGPIVSGSNSLVGVVMTDNVGFINTALSNGNYVVSSPFWNGDIGAATWGNGSTGTFGMVGTGNSLTGTTAGDMVPSNVVALINSTHDIDGNYVVVSDLWTDPGPPTPFVGAATFLNGTGPTAFPVSTTNSLTGSNNSDVVGAFGFLALTNGNYVVLSADWNGGLGAATWGDGSIGIAGPVTTINSLTGNFSGASVGTAGIALTNGNYVVLSPNWNVLGAATWVDGSMALPPNTNVTVSNSLTGTIVGDFVGTDAIALANGNYVVLSNAWNNGTPGASVGAATWGNGSMAFAPNTTVSTSNSLYGTTANDRVGEFAVSLVDDIDGHYVVLSPNWGNGVEGANVGAATLCVGTGPISTAVSTSNSLYGTFPTTGPAQGDQVGLNSALALTNGNYVVLSPSWNNGVAFASVGAATWGNGSTGITGPVTTANSLYGTTAGSSTVTGDSIGATGGVSLADGNYIVLSPFWENGVSGSYFGAVTWGNGATGIVGPVTSDNSVIGVTSVSSVIIARGASFAQDNPNTAPPTFVAPFSTDNVTGRVAVSLEDPTLVPYQFGAPQNVTISPGFVAEILNAGSSLTLQALNDINFNSPISVSPPYAVGLTGMANNNININADIVTVGGPLNLTLIANQNILSTSTFTVNTGSGNLVLVVDNANSVSPEIGTGYVSIPNATLTSTGKVQIFTALRQLNTEPGPINGVAFVPGPEFLDSATEQWGVYYSNSFGGVPYTIFYKQRGYHQQSFLQFLNTTSNTDNSLIDVDWITFIWNLYSQDLELRLKRNE